MRIIRQSQIEPRWTEISLPHGAYPPERTDHKVSKAEKGTLAHINRKASRASPRARLEPSRRMMETTTNEAASQVALSQHVKKPMPTSSLDPLTFSSNHLLLRHPSKLLPVRERRKSDLCPLVKPPPQQQHAPSSHVQQSSPL